MTIYQWTVFLAVAEQKSFVRAAQALNVTQSAVSHIISKMEEEYGYPFFVRNKNNVELTSSGRIMMPYVRNLLACSDSLEQTAAGLKNVSRGEVKIAAFNSATVLWIPPILKRFREKYADIRVSVIQSGDWRIRRMVEAGEADLAFLPKDIAEKEQFIPLHNTPMVCLAPKDFHPKNGESVTPEDLKDVPLILQSEGYDTEMKQYIEENKLSVQSNYRIEVDDTCHAFVEQGLGCCIASLMTARCNPRDVNIWPLLPRHNRTIGLVTVYPDYISPATELLKKEILSYMKENGLINVEES
ncbi:LysR family transcriptional regulator [Hominifimenecus sp. rT4P-3]|uniref:LysR family transcriptional regulator n=1 Tax=Hominifimenecus sp. rT4P-3 TaxID=3242979 RepID=UPI003DA1D981